MHLVNAISPWILRPGAGGLLLAGIVGEMATEVQSDLREHLYHLLEDLAAGRRIPQPRVRHRFQIDTVGLLRSSHRLVALPSGLTFEFEGERGLPVQHALGALYAAGQLPAAVRDPVFDSLRAALVWGQPVDERFISSIMGGRASSLEDLRAWNDPVSWALETLGLEPGATRRSVLKRYRVLLRDAHPDHGAAEQQAAARISELSQAQRHSAVIPPSVGSVPGNSSAWRPREFLRVCSQSSQSLAPRRLEPAASNSIGHQPLRWNSRSCQGAQASSSHWVTAGTISSSLPLGSWPERGPVSHTSVTCPGINAR